MQRPDEDPLVTSDIQQRKCTPWHDAGVLGTVAGHISAGVLALEPSPDGSACLTKPGPIAEGAVSRRQHKCRGALENCRLVWRSARHATLPQTCGPAYREVPRMIDGVGRPGRWRVKAIYSLQQLSTCRYILDRLRGKRLDGRVETRSACERRPWAEGRIGIADRPG